jgi:hypothetical protein
MISTAPLYHISTDESSTMHPSRPLHRALVALLALVLAACLISPATAAKIESAADTLDAAACGLLMPLTGLPAEADAAACVGEELVVDAAVRYALAKFTAQLDAGTGTASLATVAAPGDAGAPAPAGKMLLHKVVAGSRKVVGAVAPHLAADAQSILTPRGTR